MGRARALLERADFESGDVERVEVKPLALEDLVVRPRTMLERNGGECVETVLVSTSSASDEVASRRKSLVWSLTIMSGDPLFRAWRRLPRPVREFVRVRVGRVLAPRPSPPSVVRTGAPLVAGLLGTADGLGEGARLMRHAMAELGLEPAACDLSGAFRLRDLPDSIAVSSDKPSIGGPLVMHVNPPQLPAALIAMGRSAIRRRLVIGYWAWELPEMPAAWRQGFDFVHEVWAPSKFTAAAFSAASPVPVRVVPHPVRPLPSAPADRAQFGLPADAFVVLTVANLRSTIARKNPIGAILSFRKAYGDDPRRVLVVKIGNPSDDRLAYGSIRDAINSAPNVRVITDHLSPSDMASLFRVADAVLSLHRSEGFGLVPAQAMIEGKPVVATAWSGNMDFMTKQNSILVDYELVPAYDPQGMCNYPSQRWAEPRLDHAAEWLRRLAGDADLRRRLGTRASEDATRFFETAAFRKALSESFIAALSAKTQRRLSALSHAS